jgi:hypothetical protein
MLIFGGAYITRQDVSFLVLGGAYFISTEIAPTGATVKVYNGTAWNTHPLKVYDGAAFVQAKEVVTF